MEPHITHKEIDRVLAFLPRIENSDDPLYWVDQNSSPLDPYVYAPVINDLIQALYATGFVYPFEWTKWQDQARQYVDNPDLLADADIETLRKLFTTHARIDRFVGGHLAKMIENGHLLAILKQLAQIRREMR